MNKQKWNTILYRIIFPLVLLLYPLLQINQGVDITDTGYNLGGFFYRGQIGEQWLLLSTYLANTVGGMLCKLPAGDTLLGMNFYTGLLVSVAALLVYVTFYKKMPAWLVFIGELSAIGLAWCPTVILYNYLTYFLFLVVTLCLYQALTKEKHRWFVAAGVALGLNVFVRFPNIAESALILAVWYYGFLQKKKAAEVVKETLLCLLGLVAGFGTMLAAVTVQFGTTAYTDMLSALFSLGSEAGGGHSIGSMLWMIVRAYGKALGWAMYLLTFAAVGIVFFLFVKKTAETQRWYKKEYTAALRVLYMIGILVLFRLLYARGMFGFDYYVDGAVFQWAAVFLLFSIAFALCVLFQRNEKNGSIKQSEEFKQRAAEQNGTEHDDSREKLYAVLVLIVIVITPLGSDNHIYTNMNNLFVVAPFTLYELWKFVCRSRSTVVFPVQAVLCMSVLMLLIQSVGFGSCYVFRDGSKDVPRDTKITGNATLRGMYTGRENAETIEELTAFCEENGLIGQEVLLCGGSAMAEGIPGLSYYLKMPAAISNAWPELESYPYEAMESEIKAMLQNTGARPVILVSSRVGAWLAEDLQEMNALGVDIERYNNDRKLQLVRMLVTEKNYEEAFSNAGYVIYE